MFSIKKEKTQMSESYIVGLLLAIIGGYLDSYTFFSRGQVFANTQTGNIILLGLNIAEQNWIEVFHYIIPILAFILGVILSEAIKIKFKQNTNIHWRQIVILIEIIALFIVAFIPQGKMNIVVTTSISFVCSLQYVTFKKFTTTMCTGNLRSATENLFLYKNTKDIKVRTKSLQTYGIILFFITGAILGAFFTKIFIEKSVLFTCALLIFVFALMFIKEKQ